VPLLAPTLTVNLRPKTFPPMAIELSPQESEEAIRSLKKYFLEESGETLGDLRAKLLLDYILKDIAPLAYNRGVQHGEEFFRKRLEDLPATCFEPPFTYWIVRDRSKIRRPT
jgi:uncharacterized protein (DUF2164 family)